MDVSSLRSNLPPGLMPGVSDKDKLDSWAEFNSLEQKIKDNGGTGKVDGKLSYEEIQELFGKDAIKKENFDVMSKNGLVDPKAWSELKKTLRPGEGGLLNQKA